MQSRLIRKDLMLGKIKGKRRRGQQRMRWLDGFTDSKGVDLSKFREIVEDRGGWRAAVPGSPRVRWDLMTEQPQQNCYYVFLLFHVYNVSN